MNELIRLIRLIRSQPDSNPVLRPLTTQREKAKLLYRASCGWKGIPAKCSECHWRPECQSEWRWIGRYSE